MKIVWDGTGQHLYETGVKQGVLYVQNSQGAYPNGVAWNGLTTVTESPSGAEATALYADDIKYLNLYSAEEFGATVEAYTYPDEFALCDGSAALSEGVMIGQQPRKSFGLCYRTVIGNEVDGENHGYKLHMIYGAMASPSEKAYSTINDSPEAITFSWELKTTPVVVTNHKPTASLTIDSTKVEATKLAALEKILYGFDVQAFDATKTYEVGDYCTHTEGTTTKTYKCITAISTPAAWDASKWEEASAEPRLPLPDEIATIFNTVG